VEGKPMHCQLRLLVAVPLQQWQWKLGNGKFSCFFLTLEYTKVKQTWERHMTAIDVLQFVLGFR